jgi:hypothetical protein
MKGQFRARLENGRAIEHADARSRNFTIAKQKEASGYFEQVRSLMLTLVHIEGHCGSARREDAKVRRHPSRTVGGENADRFARRDASFAKVLGNV